MKMISTIFPKNAYFEHAVITASPRSPDLTAATRNFCNSPTSLMSAGLSADPKADLIQLPKGPVMSTSEPFLGGTCNSSVVIFQTERADSGMSHSNDVTCKHDSR